MAELQSQFNKFHEAIKLDFDSNKPLRDRRDIILQALRTGLKKTNIPTFDWFNQGSYDMATGVEPLIGDDYDIDVGIVFNFTKDRIEPVALKEVIYDILNATYQRKVEMKRPCVRVQYHQAGEKAYHIDLAIYAHGKNIWGNMNNDLYIAKGYSGSSEDKKIWEISEPYKLKEEIKTKISNPSDMEQFRRVVRYLKRWKDYNFSSAGTGKPTGIALTACCYYLFSVHRNLNSSGYNDLGALYNVVNKIVKVFNGHDRISAKLPVNPRNDLFERMTDNQMQDFKKKLEIFRDTIECAIGDVQVTKACMRLRGVFGSNFPLS